MNTLFLRTAGILTLASILILGSCKKDDTDIQTEKLTEDQIDNYVDISTTISAQMKISAMSFYSKALEKGFSGQIPGMGGTKSGLELSGNDFSWRGPDAQGWYYRTWDGLYKFTEKLRTRKDTVEHVYLTDGGSEYRHEVTTLHIRYTRNNKELIKGYTKIDTRSFGYNNISRTNWKMDFKDWDPKTGAGIFNWYWGVSVNKGGNTVPDHKYLHIEATPTTNNWLHVRVIIYDDSGHEVWDFEYDTPFEPVDLPEEF